MRRDRGRRHDARGRGPAGARGAARRRGHPSPSPSPTRTPKPKRSAVVPVPAPVAKTVVARKSEPQQAKPHVAKKAKKVHKAKKAKRAKPPSTLQHVTGPPVKRIPPGQAKKQTEAAKKIANQVRKAVRKAIKQSVKAQTKIAPGHVKTGQAGEVPEARQAAQQGQGVQTAVGSRHGRRVGDRWSAARER